MARAKGEKSHARTMMRSETDKHGSLDRGPDTQHAVDGEEGE